MLGRRLVQLCAVALVAVLGMSACKGEARVASTVAPPTTTSPPATAPPTTAPPGVPAPTKLSLLAMAKGSAVHVHAAPGDTKVVRTLSNPTIEAMPLAMFAVDQHEGWFQVRFPERPNGSMGWVRGDEITLTPVENRIVISLGARTVRVLDKNQQVIYETHGAVGKPRTPTPLGRFYVDVWLPNPGSPYGKFMLSIAGFSDVLKNFGGGRGQIALHGWADPSAMGKNVSNGCIRMRNDDIVRLSELAPLGTPVEIIA